MHQRDIAGPGAEVAGVTRVVSADIYNTPPTMLFQEGYGGTGAPLNERAPDSAGAMWT